MNGVEILSQTEVVAATACNTTASALAFVFTCLAMIALGGFGAYETKEIGCLFLSFILGLLLSAGVAGIVETCTTYPTEYETHYKVTIDDSVSMNEFLDKYEILAQEGKIYTVKEKE